MLQRKQVAAIVIELCTYSSGLRDMEISKTPLSGLLGVLLYDSLFTSSTLKGRKLSWEIHVNKQCGYLSEIITDYYL